MISIAPVVLRVRANGRALVPEVDDATGRRYVGWRVLKAPLHPEWDVALNESRRAAGLPTLVQHAFGGGVAWLVPLAAPTVLRARGERLEHFLRALADGELIAVDPATQRHTAAFDERRKASDARAWAAQMAAMDDSGECT